MKKVLVCGAGGFIGSHLVKKLRQLGYYVLGADLKYPEYSSTQANEFFQVDLRNATDVKKIITSDIDTVYQLAADMGGAGYVFSGANDAEIMHNSVTINCNIADAMVSAGVKNVFFTSSACAYPAHLQEFVEPVALTEDSAYPANPDSDYGWEKLFSERLYLAYARNHGLRVRIARLHNVFGTETAWNNGKEKAPAALCRKVAQAQEEIEIWGPGTQTRSFLYIDQCVEGILRIQNSDYGLPLNLGSDRLITINDLALLIAKIAGKNIKIKNIPGFIGVMGRNSDNTLISQQLKWAPEDQLEVGLEQTYHWVEAQTKSL